MPPRPIEPEPLRERALLFLRHLDRRVWAVVAVVLVSGFGIVNVWIGSEISFAVFYLIPVSLVAWYAGRGLGVASAFLSALAWLVAETLSGQVYTHPLIPYWNSITRLGFFVVVAELLSALRASLDRERELARRDFLTGAANAHLFTDLLQVEIDRSTRYRRPFSIAYVDLDNFKSINDSLGHHAGDEVLRAVTGCIRSQVRRTDVVARLGGDEFAVLLRETGREEVQIAIDKIHASLTAEMTRHGWPVTFSMGVLTYVDAPLTIDEAIKLADALMYSVKRSGKNAVAYLVHPSGEPAG